VDHIRIPLRHLSRLSKEDNKNNITLTMKNLLSMPKKREAFTIESI